MHSSALWGSVVFAYAHLVHSGPVSLGAAAAFHRVHCARVTMRTPGLFRRAIQARSRGLASSISETRLRWCRRQSVGLALHAWQSGLRVEMPRAEAPSIRPSRRSARQSVRTARNGRDSVRRAGYRQLTANAGHAVEHAYRRSATCRDFRRHQAGGAIAYISDASLVQFSIIHRLLSAYQ
jgi:hypothetical protein